MMPSFHCFVLLVTVLLTKHTSSSPNIIFILTDDQDVVLGGMNPMTKTKKLIGDAGVIFQNMFVSTPLCCPSRSCILTGRYIHNIGVRNNSVSGGCSSSDFQKGPETRSFAAQLKKHNYTTFFAGKYLNQYGFKRTGGPQHIPPGWDYWNGLVGNSVYYDYVLSANGKAERHDSNYSQDYLTHVIHQKATKFLTSEQSRQPFFMMLSTPACHAPFTPAPQHEANFSQCQAPRNGSYNVHGKDKHWLIRRAANPLSNISVTYLDDAFRNRWRTLLSVDEMVEDLIRTLDKNKLLDNTYIFFSSDNGFHLGQFSLPNDKRQMYEFDIRVPLMVRGPGIKTGQVRKEMVVNIDLAPTFIDLATGGKFQPDMDGMSFKSLLLNDKSVRWRNTFLVQYFGEHHLRNKGCAGTQGLANCHPDCVCEDAVNNTYECVRGTTATLDNFMYCSFDDDEGFEEFYNLSKDPDQLENRVRTIHPSTRKQLKQALHSLSGCKGKTCRMASNFSFDGVIL